MALTSFQRELLRELSGRRHVGNDSYVAGGMALNVLAHEPPVSRDIDLFQDTAALQATWDADRMWLESAGYAIEVMRERPTYIEADIERNGESVVIQWMDSAFRFFPPLPHAWRSATGSTW